MAHVVRRTETVRLTLPPDTRSLQEREKNLDDSSTDTSIVDSKKNSWRQSSIYQKLIRSLYDALVITDESGNIIDVNDRANLLFGRHRKELVGLPIHQLVDGVDGDFVGDIWQNVENDAFMLVEAYCLRAEGEDFPAEIAVHSIDLSEKHLCFLIRDISKRIHMERNMFGLSRAAEESVDAMAIFDNEGVLLYKNPTYDRLFGLRGDVFENLFCDPEQTVPTLNEAIHSCGSWSEEAEVLTADGKTLTVLFRASSFSAFDEVAGISVIMTDISESKEKEQQLRQTMEELAHSNADLEQFAYVASHDLKEPLRAIASYLNLCERRYGKELPEGARKFIGNAIAGAGRMQNMVKHILDYSRLNRNEDSAESVDCAILLDQALVDLDPLIKEKGAIITYGNLPVIHAVSARIVLVFQNILANAMKFCETTPRIKISSEERDGFHVFLFEDNGIGIPEELAERIFLIFHRLNPASEYAGTGIGLSSCRKIVEQHKGKIWVERSAPGEGTVMAFSLPRHSEA